ncbi:unnamed protein product [Bursaphelenchus okinawaensis]|uniref:Uncharacterized protein n=1 Tax=Bursaphelenchus okinawaensis TaxID=465554 RepID=A0A811JUN2_9BILA|nr:unnamed protein product [Bursaphelenchus okinawaensis]CAG9083876.1 unnamed protein product [Bursaphelenchus okinawaensis]
MLSLDWLFEGMVPNIMKQQAGPLFAKMTPDVELDDKVFGYKLKGVNELNSHLLKVRTYFRYKSPYVKAEYKGAIIYEGEDVVTFLWKLNILRSSFMRYFPAFVTGKQTEFDVREGALVCSVNEDGKIYKMLNRPVTEADKEAAAQLKALKDEMKEEEKKQALKEKLE